MKRFGLPTLFRRIALPAAALLLAGGSGGLSIPPVLAQAQSPAMINTPQVRVKVYVLGLHCMYPEYTQEKLGADEVYAISMFQGARGAVQGSVTTAISINNNDTRYYPSAQSLVFDEVLPASATVAGALALMEDDGFNDWRRHADILANLRHEMAKDIRTIPGMLAADGKVADLDSTHLLTLAKFRMFYYSDGAGIEPDKDDKLGGLRIDTRAAGPASERGEQIVTKTGPEDVRQTSSSGDWRYKVMYLVTREPVPASGSPAPAPTPTPTPTPLPTPPPGQTPEQARQLLNGLVGTWRTNNGSILSLVDAVVTAGTPQTVHGSATKSGQSLEDFYLRNENGSVEGLWKSTPSADIANDLNAFGKVYITGLSPDGNTFSGKVILRGGNTFPYTGTRITDSPASPGNNTPDTPGVDPAIPGSGNTGIVPPNLGTGTGRIGDGRFRPLDNFDVRFDEIRPGRLGNTIEVFATFKNTTRKDQGITAGSFDPTLLDPDGVVIPDHGNLYRASGDQPERLERTVIVTPGDQAKVRYVFDMPAHVSRLKSLRIVEYNSRPVLMDISGIAVPGAEDATAAAEPALPENIVPVPGAKFVGIDDLDVRIDGVRRGRNGKSLEAFATVKNTTQKTQALGGGTLDLTVTDEDGVGTRRIGNLYSATGERPEYLNRNILIAPGGQARTRFVFELASPDAKLVKLTIKGYQPPPRTITLPDLPNR